jgi:hypothetical protein
MLRVPHVSAEVEPTCFECLNQHTSSASRVRRGGANMIRVSQPTCFECLTCPPRWSQHTSSVSATRVVLNSFVLCPLSFVLCLFSLLSCLCPLSFTHSPRPFLGKFSLIGKVVSNVILQITDNQYLGLLARNLKKENVIF